MRADVTTAVSIREERADGFAAYASVPIAFEGRSRLDLAALRDPAGFRLVERPVAPFRKEYDAIESPLAWPGRFATSSWGVLAARDAAGGRIGGAVVIVDAPGIDLLEGRRDLALVWDLRVAPEWRGRGVGRALWDAAVGLARARGAAELRVETQDVNVAACRFYAARGCRPIRVDEGAYPGLDEAQVLWSLDPRGAGRTAPEETTG